MFSWSDVGQVGPISEHNFKGKKSGDSGGAGGGHARLLL